MEIRPTSNNETALAYRAKKLMSQTVSIQPLALLRVTGGGVRVHGQLFIFIIFILLRLECIKYIKYGTSSMLVLDKKRDKIVDYWIMHATSEPGL